MKRPAPLPADSILPLNLSTTPLGGSGSGRLAVQLAVDSFQRSSITPKQVMAVSAVIATHLEALREQCKMAAELCEDDMVGFQFKACGRGLSGATSMLVAAVKSYIDMPTDQSRLSLQAFSTPLLASIDSLLMYVHSSDAFLGESSAPGHPRQLLSASCGGASVSPPCPG